MIDENDVPVRAKLSIKNRNEINDFVFEQKFDSYQKFYHLPLFAYNVFCGFTNTNDKQQILCAAYYAKTNQFMQNWVNHKIDGKEFQQKEDASTITIVKDKTEDNTELTTTMLPPNDDKIISKQCKPKACTHLIFVSCFIFSYVCITCCIWQLKMG